jgi:hypothetical protein
MQLCQVWHRYKCTRDNIVGGVFSVYFSMLCFIHLDTICLIDVDKRWNTKGVIRIRKSKVTMAKRKSTKEQTTIYNRSYRLHAIVSSVTSLQMYERQHCRGRFLCIFFYVVFWRQLLFSLTFVIWQYIDPEVSNFKPRVIVTPLNVRM